MSDWANHLSTIFPGGAAQALPRDARRRRRAVAAAAALPAFWVGLLYDDDALDACWDIVKDWTAEERQKLRDDVPRLGFKATIRDRNVLDARAGDAAACRAGPGAPQAARPQRPRRDALSAAAGGDRRARHHAGRRAAGEIPRRVGRLGRADLRRVCVLIVLCRPGPSESLSERPVGRVSTGMARIAVMARRHPFEYASLRELLPHCGRSITPPPARSDKLSSEEMMCSASASASAELSCALRTSPTRQPAIPESRRAALSTRMPGRKPDSGEHRNRQPDSTAAATALAFELV